MSAFLSLAAPVRALFALTALLLCLANLGSALLSAVGKRYRFTAAALGLLAAAYVLWQVIFDLSLFGGTAQAQIVSRTLGDCPWALWLSVFFPLAAATALLFRGILRYDRTSITPGTVKLFLDRLPCGICCWADSGRVLFSNMCMNRLCQALTGAPLRSGNSFREALPGEILTAEGRAWRFSCREFTLDGERLYELIASDITVEYGKTQALERDRAELASLGRELREYYLSIDDVVRRQEVLKARADIHDEMNRLMLSAMTASGDDPATLDRIFLLWEQNALLLGKAAEPGASADGLEKLAAALGLRLVWQGAVPETLTGPQRELFAAAAQEAAANAVKHAGAKTLTISFSGTDRTLCCRFINDGRAPEEIPRFTGGLANLSMLAEAQGGSLAVTGENPFTLSLSFPKIIPSADARCDSVM